LRRVATAFFVATVGTAVFGGTAHAATLTPTPAKACYVSGEQVDVNGTGFTPSSTVNATFAGNSGTFVTDTAGAMEPLRLTFPSVKGIKLLTMTVTDDTNPAITASLDFRTTLLHIDVNPTNAKAGKKLRIKGYGLLGGKKVYMHVRGPHHYRSDTKVARTKAPCGTFKIHRKIVPAGARPGVYKVLFDAKKKFSKKTEPQTGGTLTVTKTFG
jgi:hypothetical protein